MTARHLRLILPAMLLGVAALSARADSLAASSAAGGSSASSASSASSDKSSDSSSKNTKVAAGPYRIVDVTVVPHRPGMLRLRLQALAGALQDARCPSSPKPLASSEQNSISLKKMSQMRSK